MPHFPKRARLASLAGAVVLATLALAGCAATQPGDKNPGAGYTNEVGDLLVKIPALRSDPCRGVEAGALFAGCGRYVTEIANTLAALRADLPGQGAAANALQDAVNTYQRLNCDSAGNAPSAEQRAACPGALRTIGAQLDALQRALANTPTSR